MLPIFSYMQLNKLKRTFAGAKKIEQYLKSIMFFKSWLHKIYQRYEILLNEVRKNAWETSNDSRRTRGSCICPSRLSESIRMKTDNQYSTPYSLVRFAALAIVIA